MNNQLLNRKGLEKIFSNSSNRNRSGLIIILQNPEFLLATNTLEIVKEELSGFDYGIVGSYARMILNGEDAKDPFHKGSDIDVAIGKQFAKMAAEKLMETEYFNKIIDMKKYSGGGKFKDVPEYLLAGVNITPIHIVGSFSEEQKALSTIIDGTRYLPTKPGMY